GPITEPVNALGVEPVQPAARLLGMAAKLPRDRRNAQPVPAQRDDPGPLAPVRRGAPGSGQLTDLPLLTVTARRPRSENLPHRPHPQATSRCPTPPILRTHPKRNVALTDPGNPEPLVPAPSSPATSSAATGAEAPATASRGPQATGGFQGVAPPGQHS